MEGTRSIAFFSGYMIVDGAVGLIVSVPGHHGGCLQKRHRQ
ncbi:hypothetical protein PT7_0852 [Pusillimonas sp. T7-7]|nr:hypothetical protein PT7_0852 [Pusillimonas sp. T7-7]